MKYTARAIKYRFYVRKFVYYLYFLNETPLVFSTLGECHNAVRRQERPDCRRCAVLDSVHHDASFIVERFEPSRRPRAHAERNGSAVSTTTNRRSVSKVRHDAVSIAQRVLGPASQHQCVGHLARGSRHASEGALPDRHQPRTLLLPTAARVVG